MPEGGDRRESRFAGPDDADALPPAAAAGTEIASSVLAWCVGFRTPAIVSTPDCTILWCNDVASAMLAEREHFCLRGQKLVCADGLQDGDFREFIKGNGNEPATWLARSEASMVIVMRERVPGTPGLRGLTFHRTGAEVTYVWADFGPALGLTSAEARIAQKLMEGGRADGIALQLGIGLETVRTHIRRTYNKLGINSREELFLRLAAFRLR